MVNNVEQKFAPMAASVHSAALSGSCTVGPQLAIFWLHILK